MSSELFETVREEDFVEYHLYPPPSPSDESENDLESVLSKCRQIATDFCKDYIWHKDPFRIKIEPKEEGNAPAASHIVGVSHYGDNVEDEWFIVALLYELTRQIPGLVARIFDSDGDFMLVEAADALPAWATPETCEGRVYICGGALYIVQAGEEKEKIETISEAEALELIRSEQGSKFKVSTEVEECIQKRTKDYPANVRASQHRATLFVPIGVAVLLKQRPQLIAAAVTAFCNRDFIDKKVIRAMRFFPPEDRVYTSVLFTRCLYAQLLNTNYIPDRRTGWNLPPHSSPDHKAHLLGVKIACGFEIIASQAKADDPETDRAWQAYVESLKKKGYFRDLLEGSKDYVNLLEKARDYYRETELDVQTTPQLGLEIQQMLKAPDFNAEEIRRQESCLPLEDSDEWLNISAEELDERLARQYGRPKSISSEAGGADLTKLLNGFLHQKSEFDGVTYTTTEDKEEGAVGPPVRPPRGIKRNRSKPLPLREISPAAAASGPIDFDPNAFQSTVQNLLELIIPEDKWNMSDDSEMSDYENDYELEANIEEMAAGDVRADFKQYLDDMDRELAATTIGQSFERKAKAAETEDDPFADIEDFQPVDIDANTVKNMMESYKAQFGGPGPASNLLGSMGVKLADKEEEEGAEGAEKQDEVLKDTKV